MKQKVFYCFIFLATFVSFHQQVHGQNTSLGIFDDQGDVGVIKQKGSGSYDPKLQVYNLSGSGANIWAKADAFHFVWKRMKGDFILRTNAAFICKGVEDHRKIGLMVRTSLDSNSKHVNAVVHGVGLASLQFRKTVGGETEEKKSTITHADVIQLERHGGKYTMSVARKGDLFVEEEVSDVDLGDDVYVGIFICSHNANVTEKAIFNNVRIVIPAPGNLVPYKQYLGSSIEILDLETQNSRIVYQSPKSLQAPNWMQDGKNLLYNSEGLLYKFDLKTTITTMYYHLMASGWQ
jgi:TolB protein